MAKIKFGMMMTDARGKLGGQVFSKNRSGAYIRTKVTPVNPRTQSQQANRSLLGTISANWSMLSPLQRASWNSVVEQWQKTNIFGDLHKPSGKNLFTGLNKVRLSLFPDLPVLAIPPTKEEFTSFVIESAYYVPTTRAFGVVLTGEVPEGTTFRVRATGGLSAGTSFFANRLRSLPSVVTSTGGNTLVLTVPYEDKFGVVASGQVIGVEIAEVKENGQLGVPSLYTVLSE